MKPRRRIDPELMKMREDRSRKKLQRRIKLLERRETKPKPIDEIHMDAATRESLSERVRPQTDISEEERDQRAAIFKNWARDRMLVHQREQKSLEALIRSQRRALDHLKSVSEALYLEALQVDEDLLPLNLKAPVLTPPIHEYNQVDGDYEETTKQWNP